MRDDFTKATIDILAKRVGYLCSNPNCRQLTVGANEVKDKTTIIGIASHITAASCGGPRYKSDIKSEQRKDINNGIWLCSNCANLIDKDPEKYSIELLEKWKYDAEEDTRRKLESDARIYQKEIPYLEADLILSSKIRRNNGYSHKNPTEIYNGKLVYNVGNNPIIHWILEWYYKLDIYNNSQVPAYNIKIESVGKVHFEQLEKLKKINNLPPLDKIELKAKFQEGIESTSSIADEILRPSIPQKFNDVILKVTFSDEQRRVYTLYIEFENGEIINRKDW